MSESLEERVVDLYKRMCRLEWENEDLKKAITYLFNHANDETVEELLNNCRATYTYNHSKTLREAAKKILKEKL